MWDRIKLKNTGKAAFKRNYWPCVGVCILLAIAVGAFSFNFDFENFADVGNIIKGVLGIIGLSSSIFALALNLLVFHPYNVGARRFLMENRYAEKATFSIVGYGFNKNYGNVILVMFMKNLFIALWSLLFVIPGIIKIYAYFAVPYILAENPDLKYKRAITISKEMTKGYKWKIFCLQFSFIGWGILTGLTAGIVGAFHYFPYLYATESEAYAFLREEALAKGIATAEELPGFGEPQAQEPQTEEPPFEAE